MQNTVYIYSINYNPVTREKEFFMIDPVVGYDSYDYNNGNPPAAGLVWSGESWGWPVYDTGNGGDTMVLWPSTDNSVPDTVKEAVDSDICLRCGQKNCPYIKDGKDYKDLRNALRNNNMSAAKRIYLQRFAQFSGTSNGRIKEAIQKKKEARQEAEKESLTKASELIVDMGEKIGAHLGDKYKSVAREIAENVKNFQGRTLRNYEQTMASLNKILDNPGMKVNKGDKDAIINAWKSLNADDTAKKLANLSKSFAIAGLALKVEKVREKSIEGHETGNWGPLVLEVESWVLSGVTVGVAIGILAKVAPVVAAFASIPASAVMIIGIIIIGIIASKIDDKFADWINNELIRPVH